MSTCKKGRFMGINENPTIPFLYPFFMINLLFSITTPL